MFAFPWNDNLLTGIDTIDKQHKEFVAIVNMYILKAEKELTSLDLKEVLDFLDYFASVHFQAEESFMAASSFVDYRNHSAEHKQILFKLKRLTIRNSDPNEDKEELATEVIEFIRDGLVNHIGQWDKKFSKYYRQYSANIEVTNNEN